MSLCPDLFFPALGAGDANSGLHPCMASTCTSHLSSYKIMDSIITFSYTRAMDFDHIHPIPSLVLPLPSTSLLLLPKQPLLTFLSFSNPEVTFEGLSMMFISWLYNVLCSHPLASDCMVCFHSSVQLTTAPSAPLGAEEHPSSQKSSVNI